MIIGTFFYYFKIKKIMFINKIMLTTKRKKYTPGNFINFVMKCKQFFTKQWPSFFSNHEINMSVFDWEIFTR